MIRFSHIKLLYRACLGILYKISLNLNHNNLRLDTPKQPKLNSELIVSLTSYGRRVNKTVYYTILSIINQTVKPSRIILWLDSNNWNSQNLPHKLKKLEKKGVEIKFTEDTKSYKKLIPTLQLFPDAIIVTVDDDVIYSKHLLESLYKSYLLNQESVHCTRASILVFKDKTPTSYKTWAAAKSNDLKDNEVMFPVGIGGILYPPHSLHSDVVDKELYTKYCPEADDIWFWRMAKLNGFSHTFVKLSPNIYPFDAIYQALHRGSALTHSNVGRNKNDAQLKAVLEAYPL